MLSLLYRDQVLIMSIRSTESFLDKLVALPP